MNFCFENELKKIMIQDSKDHIQELVGKGFLTYLVGQYQHVFTAFIVYCT